MSQAVFQWLLASDGYFFAAAAAGMVATLVCLTTLLVAVIQRPMERPTTGRRVAWMGIATLSAAPSVIGMAGWRATRLWLDALAIENGPTPWLYPKAYSYASHGLIVGAGLTLVCWCLVGLAAVRGTTPAPGDDTARRVRTLTTVVIAGLTPLVVWTTLTLIKSEALLAATGEMAPDQIPVFIGRAQAAWDACARATMLAALACAVAPASVLYWPREPRLE